MAVPMETDARRTSEDVGGAPGSRGRLAANHTMVAVPGAWALASGGAYGASPGFVETKLDEAARRAIVAPRGPAAGRAGGRTVRPWYGTRLPGGDEALMPSVARHVIDSTALPSADLCLVSCVARKLPRSARAEDLYVSDLFRKVRGFVEARDWRWFILSAKYGLVEPERFIDPYERTLNSMGVAARRDWAERCLDALGPHLAGVESVVFLAGAKYREFLAPALGGRGIKVHVPMAGMRIGEQLAWLNRVNS